MKKSLWVCVLGTLLMFSSGCGGGKKQDAPTVSLHPVTGKVSFDGKAAPGAVVTLHPAQGGAANAVTPFGIADETGQFQVSTYAPADGAPEGRYKVTVSWADVKNPGASDPEYGPEKLPRKYLSPSTSGLEVEVKPGSTEVPPLVLTRR